MTRVRFPDGAFSCERITDYMTCLILGTSPPFSGWTEMGLYEILFVAVAMQRFCTFAVYRLVYVTSTSLVVTARSVAALDHKIMNNGLHNYRCLPCSRLWPAPPFIIQTLLGRMLLCRSIGSCIFLLSSANVSRRRTQGRVNPACQLLQTSSFWSRQPVSSSPLVQTCPFVDTQHAPSSYAAI